MESKSTIEERDGQTVLVTPVSSEAGARALQASIEGERLRTQGNWWERMRGQADACLRITSEILATVERSYLALLAAAFGLIAAVLAARGWPALVPIEGLEWLMSLIGILLVAAIMVGSHRLWRAGANRDWTEFGCLLAGMAIAIFLNGLSSISLQSQTAEAQRIGYEDANKKIAEIEAERGALIAATFAPPAIGRVELLRGQLDAILNGAATNSLGDPITKSVAELVGDCKGEPDFYSRRYCPEIERRRGELEAASAVQAAYDKARKRLVEIDGDPSATTPAAQAGELATLRALRPKPQATLTLLRWALSSWADIVPFLPGMIVTIFVELLTGLFAFLAGRRVYLRRG